MARLDALYNESMVSNKSVLLLKKKRKNKENNFNSIISSILAKDEFWERMLKYKNKLSLLNG